MDEEIDRLVIAVRADTQAFARDIGTMRRDLEGPLGDGAERAGRAIEATLARAIRTGKLGFEELKSVALSVLAEIAASAIRSGIGAILGRGGAGGGERGGGVGGGLGGLLALGNSVLGNGVPGNVRGLPGRATGGPVAPGRGYLVGERGPEVFVPTASGSIQTTGSSTAVRHSRLDRGGGPGGRRARPARAVEPPSSARGASGADRRWGVRVCLSLSRLRGRG